eukprot:CAMPEP_0194559492 /NCGR_PEP_ID=MMETSP0292-20121207/1018_1 /TAXON_ID=39354 /ORGANISM="Heterosigma akashiwo, Strain CCMP2393" /LENGTH=55 /DNA_ID=CAMNT_0039407417 /DNA_START=150 /DNA_END=317 /DNA_ORIENTATION=+
MSKDSRSDEVVRDHGIRRHWSEKPARVLEGASPDVAMMQNSCSRLPSMFLWTYVF